MAIIYSRAEDGAYLATDTNTGAVERYSDQPSWLHASLVRILAMTERVEQGLTDLQALCEHRPAEQTTEARP